MDREKVIKGLEEAYRVIEDHVPSRYRGYSRLACCDAIALLREQDTVEHALDVLIAHGWKKDETEPVKPIRTLETIRAEYNCGSCTGKVGIKFYDGFWYFKAQYCPMCGRKVKWDE